MNNSSIRRDGECLIAVSHRHQHQRHDYADHEKYTMKNESPFGPVIFSYSRLQAVGDGVQVGVAKTAQEAATKFPMLLNRAVSNKYVTMHRKLDSKFRFFPMKQFM